MAACNKCIVPGSGSRSKNIKKNFESKLQVLQDIFPGTAGFEIYSFDENRYLRAEYVINLLHKSTFF